LINYNFGTTVRASVFSCSAFTSRERATRNFRLEEKLGWRF